MAPPHASDGVPDYPAANPNGLLSALPVADYARVAPSLRRVPLTLKAVLYRPGDRIESVYFTGSGFCSIVTTLRDGRMVEVASIGREGLVGAWAQVANVAAATIMVQAAGETCYAMPVDAFQRELSRHGSFERIVNRFVRALLEVVLQQAACNAVHSVEQRLAHWLLRSADRLDTDDFPITQDFLAIMLGVRRPTVTVIAQGLQDAGLITYQRGQVSILDRPGLVDASCECYDVIKGLVAVSHDLSYGL